MKPRILFLNHTGDLGGAELCLLDIASHFAEGSQVMLFEDGAFRHLLESRGCMVGLSHGAEGMMRIRRGSGFSTAIRAVPAVFGLAHAIARKASEFDVIYANSQKAFIVAAVASRFSGTPLLWHLHDIFTNSNFHPVLRDLAIGLANRYASRVLANSEATRAAFVQCGGRADLVQVVYPGTDPAHFADPDLTRILAWRHQHCGDAPLLGIFGRLTPWKGQHVFLKALAALPGVHGLLVGAPTYENRNFHEALKRQMEDLGIQDRVHFWGHSDEIPALMRVVDIVVHASTLPEPFGKVVVEGMLAGQPVIATAAGGVPEIIENEISGILVPPGDAGHLAEAIRNLLQNPSTLHSIGKKGHERALSRFSLERSLDEVDRAITKILTKSLMQDAALVQNGKC
ncbi:glycosyltransferase family 4 protein [Thermithiobacillus plumbiphilus]|uniref:Glycosyltransferase family 4 protein n=1 Tax=Thermithiobacillus plumbiphilus TaxID=1729899 RepID=A0ABU9DBQ0_9PROT